MRRQRITSQSSVVALARVVLLLGFGLLGGTAWAAAEYTTQFPLEQCTFVATGRNLHFSIQPGDWWLLAGEEDGGAVLLEITVLDKTRSITFVTENGVPLTVEARVVREREWVDDELVEVSWNYFARCKQTNDIYYFGEKVNIFEGGVVVSHAGAWLAGEDDALPGLIMPGTYLLGSRYVQERAPGVAEDRAKHVLMGLTIVTPAGTFTNCVEVVETTPLEPAAKSVKRYCPGIGLVTDGPVQLVDFNVAP